MVIVTSWTFVYNSWAIMEGSPDPGGIPYRYVVKGTITVGFALLCLQGISLGIHSLLQNGTRNFPWFRSRKEILIT